MNGGFERPRQLLPREAYTDAKWLERERRTLFDRAWVWAGVESELAAPGDFLTTSIQGQQLFVLRGESGELRAFHNICRHRGCELVEGKGNVGRVVRCPYHRWTYDFSGGLRAVSNEADCFGSVGLEGLSLHPASVGVHLGMVYVNPHPSPPEPFEEWAEGLDQHAWPHDFGDDSLKFAGEVAYEIRCNWKVFYENAVDGYHLGYLHDRTLGPLYPARNVWQPAGRHALWYSTERDGPPQSSSILTERVADGTGARRLQGHDPATYPGVVALFPLTFLTPNPWGISASVLEPIDAETTRMRALSWAPASSKGRLAKALDRLTRTRKSAHAEKPHVYRLADSDQHPLESGDFQIEDMWICEKIQRNLHSPHFEVGPLANGPGAESPVTHFQQSVLDYVEYWEA